MQVTCRPSSLHIVVVGQVVQGELAARCGIFCQKLLKLVHESAVVREEGQLVDHFHHFTDARVKVGYDVGRHDHTILGMVVLPSDARDRHGQH